MWFSKFLLSKFQGGRHPQMDYDDVPSKNNHTWTEVDVVCPWRPDESEIDQCFSCSPE